MSDFVIGFDPAPLDDNFGHKSQQQFAMDLANSVHKDMIDFIRGGEKDETKLQEDDKTIGHAGGAVRRLVQADLDQIYQQDLHKKGHLPHILIEDAATIPSSKKTVASSLHQNPVQEQSSKHQANKK